MSLRRACVAGVLPWIAIQSAKVNIDVTSGNISTAGSNIWDRFCKCPVLNASRCAILAIRIVATA